MKIRHYDRLYEVTARFPKTPEGVAECNKYLSCHPNEGFLKQDEDELFVADLEDKGVPVKSHWRGS